MKTTLLTIAALTLTAASANPPSRQLPPALTYQWTSGYHHYNIGHGDLYFESPHPFQEDWDHEARGRDNDGNLAVTTMTVDYTPNQLFWSGASTVRGVGKADQHVQQQFRINRTNIRIAGQSHGVGTFKISVYYIREEVHRPILVWSVTGRDAEDFDHTLQTVEGGQYRIVANAAARATSEAGPAESAEWNFTIEEEE